MYLLRKLRRLLERGLNNFIPYNSINDLPVYNWWKLNETGDLIWLLREPCKPTSIQMGILSEKYSRIMQEFYSVYGISDEYRNILNKQREIALLKCTYIITGDRINETLIDIAKFELSEMVKQETDITFYDIKAIVEKQMGFRIDARSCTVAEYYSYIKIIEKANG